MESKRVKSIVFTSVKGSDYRPSARGIRWNDPMTIDVHYTVYRANGEKFDEKERFSTDDQEFRKMRTYLILGNNLTTNDVKDDIRFDKYHVAIAMIMRAYNRHSKTPIEWKDEVDWRAVYADEASGKTDDKEARTDMTGGVKNFDDWKITDISQLLENEIADGDMGGSPEAKIEGAKKEISKALEQIASAYDSITDGMVLLENYIDKYEDDQDISKLDLFDLTWALRTLEEIYQGETNSILAALKMIRQYKTKLENFDYDDYEEED